MLVGLSLSLKKPPMQAYLKPFIEEMKVLYSEGFQVEIPLEGTQTIKVRLLQGIFDSPARAYVLNIVSYNNSIGSFLQRSPL